MSRILLTAFLGFVGSISLAAEAPVYAPVFDWVRHADLPQDALSDAAEPVSILLFDQQIRIDREDPHYHTRLVLSANTPQGLMQLNTLSAEWLPLFQTLTIHHVLIRRGGEIVDVLERGQQFFVLRRENNLEYAMLDGTLTAVLQPEGLRVGDIVDFAFTITGADPAQQGRVQGGLTLPEFDAESVRLSASWDDELDVRWQASRGFAELVEESRGNGSRTLEVRIDDARPYQPPLGAPNRFLLPPHLEFSSFASWRDVSQLAAPLFARAEQLAADSPVHDEIARIRAGHDSDLARAGAALRLVQDEVRYLFTSLEAGGLVPASADQTWSRRFGDCKGKTALLLAMLHELGIEAEPVLVQSVVGDGLPERLPMMGAFDHVIVHAEIDGNSYWLDGTRTGGPAIDRIVTPLFHWGLPIRENGAELVDIRPSPATAPDKLIELEFDFSEGLTAPGRLEGRAIIRGDAGLLIRDSFATLGPVEHEASLRAIWSRYYPAARIEFVDGRYDADSGEYDIEMKGVVRGRWLGDRFRSAVGDMVFHAEEIERPDDQDTTAPYAVLFPSYLEVRETVTLPQDGQGFSVRGASIEKDDLLGVEIRRTTTMEGATVTTVGSARSLRTEFPAEDLAAHRAALAELAEDVLYIQAPVDYRPSDVERESALGSDPVTATDYIDRGNVHQANRRLDLAIADFSAALALEPDNALAYASRAMAHALRMDAASARADLAAAEAIQPDHYATFRVYGMLEMQRGNHLGAIGHYTRAIEATQDDVLAFVNRGRARIVTSDFDGGFADMTEVTRIDPTVAEAYFAKATILSMRGQTELALREVDAMLASAAVEPLTFRNVARGLAGQGERARAIAVIDRVIEREAVAGDLLLRASLRPASEVDARRDDLEAAMLLEPDSDDVRMELADVHMDADRPDEAAMLLGSVIRRNPDKALALARRGLAYELMGDRELARLDFEAARAATDSASELNSMCWERAVRNAAIDEALRDCLRSIELRDSNAAQDSLGLIYLRLERFEDAVAAYDAAVELNVTAHSLFGRALAKRGAGDIAGYEADVAQAERLSPDVADDYAGYGLVP